MSEADDWGVLVNECKVFATTTGAEWWALASYRFELSGRMKRLVESIGGGLCHVACDSKEDAESLAQGMIEFGSVPRTSVKVTRLSTWERSRKSVTS